MFGGLTITIRRASSVTVVFTESKEDSARSRARGGTSLSFDCGRRRVGLRPGDLTGPCARRERERERASLNRLLCPGEEERESGWALSPGVLTDPHAREGESERTDERHRFFNWPAEEGFCLTSPTRHINRGGPFGARVPTRLPSPEVK